MSLGLPGVSGRALPRFGSVRVVGREPVRSHAPVNQVLSEQALSTLLGLWSFRTVHIPEQDLSGRAVFQLPWTPCREEYLNPKVVAGLQPATHNGHKQDTKPCCGEGGQVLQPFCPSVCSLGYMCVYLSLHYIYRQHCVEICAESLQRESRLHGEATCSWQHPTPAAPEPSRQGAVCGKAIQICTRSWSRHQLKSWDFQSMIICPPPAQM